MVALGLGVFATLAGCLQKTTFTCVSDTDCGAGGQCEATSFCSFPDPDCTSGRRYGDVSGAYTHECVGSTMMIDAGIDAPAGYCDVSADCTAADTPFCETSTHTCRACVDDTECASHLCSESTGVCIDADAALYVAPGGDNANACTTEAQPCATISGALGKLTSTRRSIRVADGAYSESIVLSAMGTILISGETPSFANTRIDHATAGFGTGAHDHTVESANTMLTLEGIDIRNAPNEAIRLTSGTLRLDSVRVFNAVGGIDISGGTFVMTRSAASNQASGIGVAAGPTSTITIDGSTIANNPGVGLQLGNSNFTVTNSFIVGNALGGVTIGTPGATHVFDFNTVANNAGTGPAGMRCTATVAVTNSLFAGNGAAPQLAATCTATYSLFSDVAPAGTGNTVGAPAFVSGTDFHITSASAARNAADPAASLAVDYDGEARPQGGGRDVGADEIP